MLLALLHPLTAAASYVPAQCSDLSGVWRHATVNPSAQYIAGVTKGALNRYQVFCTPQTVRVSVTQTSASSILVARACPASTRWCQLNK